MSRRCRDCADNFGTCPHDGTPCDPGPKLAQQDAPTDADDAFHLAALDYRTAQVPQDANAAYERLEAAARARHAPAQDAERERDAVLHPNHIPDLRYILAVLERLSKAKPKDGELSAAVNGMRYVVSRTEDAARAQRADKETS